MILRRLLGGVVVLWLVSIIAFLLVQLLPGDAAEALAGERATAEDVQRIREQLGFDRPILVQYATWFWDVVRGDLGTSLRNGRGVTERILEVAPATLSLTGLAILIATVLGVSAGLVAALRQGSWMDRAVSTGATLGIAMPSFWVAMLLILLFSQYIQLFPATGYTPISEGVGPWLSHLILPATALGLAVSAEVARHTRGCVADVIAKPHMRTARARGASGWWLIRKHVLRNSAIPVVTLLGLQIGRLLGGSIVIESVAGISGLGTLAISSILQRDYPVIQGYVLFSAVVVVIANLVVDLLYGWIDPKVRAS